jgi:hypothetical protein
VSNAKSSTFIKVIYSLDALSAPLFLSACSCLYLVPHCDQSLSLVRDKSSNEGQIIEALCGQSLLHKTKSSDIKRQIIETPGGQSPLHETKSSDKGQIIETLGGRSPLHKTKSSDKGQIIETLVVEFRCTRQSPPMRGRSLRLLVVKVRCTRQSPPMRGIFQGLTANDTLRQGTSFEASWPMTNLSPMVSILVCLAHPICHTLLLLIFGYNI